MELTVHKAHVQGMTEDDYSGIPSSVAFAPGETVREFTFAATDDSEDDDDESVVLEFVGLPPRVRGDARLTLSIRDDDDPEVEVSFGAPSYEAAEGESLPVLLRLSAEPERSVTIPLLVTYHGGAAASDFSGIPSTVTFGLDEREHEFTFTATDDRQNDDGEALTLSFGELPKRVSGRGETILTILDDDESGSPPGGGPPGGGGGPPGGGGAPPSDGEGDDGEGDDGEGDDGEGDDGDDGEGDDGKGDDGEGDDGKGDDGEGDDGKGDDGEGEGEGGGGGGGPPRAAITVDAECADGLCRARTGVPVRFEDTSTGFVRFRRWDFGDGARRSNRTVDHAWSEPGFYDVALWTSNGSDESTAFVTFLVEASDPAGTCAADAETLCLQDSRYTVGVEWWTAGGQRGAGTVVHAGTNDSGLFTFFSRENWEVLIKVLDGCAVNDHMWVYGASTTDLGYRVRVTDTVTGQVKEYRNEAGLPAPAITDSNAFPAGCNADAVAGAASVPARPR